MLSPEEENKIDSIEYFSELLYNIQKNNTNDIEDINNLLSAIDIFKESLNQERYKIFQKGIMENLNNYLSKELETVYNNIYNAYPSLRIEFIKRDNSTLKDIISKVDISKIFNILFFNQVNFNNSDIVNINFEFSENKDYVFLDLEIKKTEN